MEKIGVGKNMGNIVNLEGYLRLDKKALRILKEIVLQARANLDPLSALIIVNLLKEYENMGSVSEIINRLAQFCRDLDIITPEIIFKVLGVRKQEGGRIKELKREEVSRRDKNRHKEMRHYMVRTLQDYMEQTEIQEMSQTNEREMTVTSVTEERFMEEIGYIDIDLLNVKEFESQIIKQRERKLPEVLDFEVIRTPHKVFIEDSVEAFRNYFIDRYIRLRKILLKKGLSNVVSTGALKTANKGDYLIVIVRDKHFTKGKTGIIIGEDLDGEVRILIPSNGTLLKKFKHVLLDSVIAVKLSKISDEYCIADEILFPGIPRIRERHRAPMNVKVAFIADIHIGSKQFMRKRFENFMRFLRGEVKDERMQKLSEEIRYVIINGDIVDGVGVYPDQKKELEIVDIYRQYDLVAKYLSKVPDNKLIIIVPGNHDAAGKFVPQPPIPHELAKSLYELPNVKILGNPATIKIHGVRILLYHGYGLENIAAQLGMGLDSPTRVLIEILRTRHLMPEWGRIPIAPIIPDHLVIEEVPDIVVTSHLHVADIRVTAGGVLLISTGAFQGITSWQRQLGISPTIGIVPVVDLKTYETIIVNCDESGCSVLTQ